MRAGCYVVRLFGCYVPEARSRPNNLTTNNLTTFFIAAALALYASVALAGPQPAAVRLVDLLPGHYGTIIAGSSKRILGTKINEVAVALPALPPKPMLVFAAGLRPVQAGGTVLFEIALRPRTGPEVPLYSRELSEPGWWDEQVDLSPHPVEGATLLFRRKALSGGLPRVLNTGWGDPVIVSPSTPPAPSVILISLDTLRADGVGGLGNTRARTPALDALIRAGLVYEQAYSPATWTYPSHQSLLFGLDTASNPFAAASIDVVGPYAHQPIPEILRVAGYLTAGFTGGGYVSADFGFTRGFDTYYMYPYSENVVLPSECNPKRFDGEEVFGRAQRWLRERGRAPFFLFVHTYDIHDRCPFLNAKGTAFGFTDDAGRDRAMRYYEDLIAKTDARVGALMTELSTLGLDRTTLVVITSDHGDGFGEHGVIGHGGFARPYDPVVRVPLIFLYPGTIAAGQRVATPVSLVDVAPSILSLLQIVSTTAMDGRPLPGLPGVGLGGSRPIFSQSGDMLAVRDGRLKLITSRDAALPDELYDIEADPNEAHNMAATAPAELKRLQAYAATFWQRAAPTGSKLPQLEQLDTDTKERLRALGYQ